MKAAQAADGTTSRRNAPAPAGLILAFAAFVPPAIAQTPDRPAAGAPSPAALEMTWSGSTLQLRGNVSSTAHEMILRDSARRFFGADVPVQQELTLSSPPRTPPGWALVTDMVLRAIAETRSATATVTPSRVRISGVARATADLDTAMARIGKALTDGMSLDQRIVTVSDAAPFGVLCRRQLLSLTRNRRVEFHRAGAELRSGAFPTLDAIAEYAADCPDVRLRVTGHTDASGDEDVNERLSRARADAVVAYLVARGIAGTRLEAVGAGSSQPLASGADAASRRLNRRVEFQILSPED